MENINNITSSILKLTERLKENYEFKEYKNIILPFIVLKRLDSLLEFSKENILNYYDQNMNTPNLDNNLKNISIDEKGNKLGFYNLSEFNLNSIIKNKENLKENLIEYILSFSDNIRDIFDNFNIFNELENESKYELLYSFLKDLNEIDLSSKTISNDEMGKIYEELIKHFASINIGGGLVYTPDHLNKLIASILIAREENKNKKSISIYDPACGTGRLLTQCDDVINNLNKNLELTFYGQEINPTDYAISKSNLLMKGISVDNIKGPLSTLSNDQFPDNQFDYMACELPFGLRWDNERESIIKESEMGFNGRFGAGLPRKNDAQLLFIQHMISKMKKNSKSRIAIITSESPLSFGDVGSSESNIRKWLFKNDYIEAIISLPPGLFYRTHISTYIWILTNEKEKIRKGKVQLIDTKENIPKLNKKIHRKEYEITDETIENILDLYISFKETEKTKILDNDDFGFKKLTIERPMQLNYQVTKERLENLYTYEQFKKLNKKEQQAIKKALMTIDAELYTDWETFEAKVKHALNDFNLKPLFIKNIIIKLSEHDKNAKYVLNSDGSIKSDYYLRETKKIPLKQNIEDYFNEKIKNIYPDAWINYNKIKTGYEINFTHLNYDENLFFEDIDYPIVYLDDLIEFRRNHTYKLSDLIFLRVPSISKAKKIVLYPQELSENLSKIPHSLIVCKIKSKKILKEYLYYYLNSNKGLEHYLSFQRNLSRLPIPLPDINTQKKIVETYRLIEGFFKDMDIWRNNYLNNILNYQPALDTYKGFSCSIKFGDDGGVSDFCHNWRIVYQGLIWPLAYGYLKATKGSKYESTMKDNYLVFFEFLAAFNVIILISAIKNSKISHEDWTNIKKELWQLYYNNKKTWHRMHFGGWTVLYHRLTKIYQNCQFNTTIKKKFFVELSQERYSTLFNQLRDKERNPDAHSGLEDDIDIKTKLDDLKNYMDTDIFDILNLYSGLKLYYVSDEIKRISPKKICQKVMSLNGPCDPPNWHNIITYEELEPYCLYLYDQLSNSYLKLDSDLIKLGKIPDSKQYAIYIYEGINIRDNIAKYKCYLQKDETLKITLKTNEDTYFKVSDEFLKDVLRI